MTQFEWDEAKRVSNIAKHDLDFRDAAAVFDGRPVVNYHAKTETESRVVTVGRPDDGKFRTVIWTQRIGAQRVISFSRLLKKVFEPALRRKSFRFRPKTARNPRSMCHFRTDFLISGA